MLRRAHSERSLTHKRSRDEGNKKNANPACRSLDSLVVVFDSSKTQEAPATASQRELDASDVLVSAALAAMRLGAGGGPSAMRAEASRYDRADATSLVVGRKVGAGCTGELFETNVPGFLLKKADPEDYWDPEDVRGGEVEIFQAIYGETAAKHIDDKSFLIRRLPGIDIGQAIKQLTAVDADNLLKKVSEMHEKGIYHGDIAFEDIAYVKNVLFDPETREFYIIDFGSSRLFTEQAMARQDTKDLIAYEFKNIKESIYFLTSESG